MMLERICFSVLESSLVASVLYALMMLGEGRLATSDDSNTPLPQYPVVYPVRPSAGAAAGGDRLFRGQLCTGKMAAAGQGVAGGNGSVFCPSSAGILSFEQAAQPRGAPSFFKPRSRRFGGGFMKSKVP